MVSILESLEDPKRPLLGPNYWFLKKIGFLLPRSNTIKTMYIIIHAIGTLFIVTQFIELYAVRSDLNQVLTNVSVTMLSSICVAKAHTCVYWQKSWRELLNYVTEADKFERNNTDIANGPIIISTYTKYCRRVTTFYLILVYMTGLISVSSRTVKLISDTFRGDICNATEIFPHQYSSWMPFEKNCPPGSWITMLWHSCICFYGCGTLISYDSSVVVIMVFLGGKLDLLRERCKQMFGLGDHDFSNDEFKRVIHQLYQIHVQLIKYSQLFNSLLSPVMFLYTVVCSLMICACAFHLTTTDDITQQMLSAMYLMLGITQLFIFCWHSNDVLMRNENVSLGVYESSWWSANTEQRKCVLILLGQLQIINVFTAGPFIELTLSTFITILKGAYSYYTLLRD